MQTSFTVSLTLAQDTLVLQVWSTVLNFLVSTGNYLAMSYESNMGYKYIHYYWNLAHSSKTSLIFFNVLSHSSILVQKCFLNGENTIAYVLMMCSSNTTCISSNPLRMCVFLQTTHWNLILSHIANILSNMVSIWYSLPAVSPIYVILSILSIMFILSMSSNVNAGSSGLMISVTPMAADTYSQCLLVIPFFLNANNNGTLGLNSSKSFLTDSAILSTPTICLSDIYLIVYYIFLIPSSTIRSASSAST